MSSASSLMRTQSSWSLLGFNSPQYFVDNYVLSTHSHTLLWFLSPNPNLSCQSMNENLFFVKERQEHDHQVSSTGLTLLSAFRLGFPGRGDAVTFFTFFSFFTLLLHCFRGGSGLWTHVGVETHLFFGVICLPRGINVKVAFIPFLPFTQVHALHI